MREYLNDCLEPLFITHWDKDLITMELINSVRMYIIYHDNRVTNLMFNEI